MGIVQDYLRDLIQQQVDDYRLVVWFDPDRYYERFAETLSVPETTVARYAGSFFALRREIEPLLGGETPPRLLVYVPLAEEETHHALVELTKAGTVLKPGQNPWQRNTRPSVVAKMALQRAWGEAGAVAVAQNVEAGKLSFEELDELRSSSAPAARVNLTPFRSYLRTQSSSPGRRRWPTFSTTWPQTRSAWWGYGMRWSLMRWPTSRKCRRKS